MQPATRTPSSILRKRPSQDEQNKRKSMRARGRRVSFAPDDELETRHLFSIDKGSPALPSQDTQPLAELAQNQFPPPPQHGFPAPAAAGSKWGPYDRMQACQGDSDLLVQPQQHALQQPEAFLLSPEPASPQSMELTNDTLQGPGGMGFPGFTLRDENDSLVFHGGHAAAAAAAGQDLHGGTGLFAGRDGTYNITGDVPKLSALLEEDEEGEGTGAAAYSADEADSEDVAMELTGNTMHAPAPTPAPAAAAGVDGAHEVTPENATPSTRRRTRSSAAADAGPATATATAAAAAAPSPAVSPAPRRSSRRTSTQDITPPALAAAATAAGTPLSGGRGTPKGRGRRGSGAAAAAPEAPAGAAQDTPEGSSQQPMLSPRRGRSAAAAAAAAMTADSARKAPAPSLDPTPSPLRRITRSMASPLESPVLGGAGAGLGDLTEGFTEKLLEGLGAAVAAGGGGGGRRSSMNRFAQQQSRWGFVPGEEDTLNINMNLPGAGGLGETTLHHVYSDSAGTGELTASMKTGQHAAAAAAAAGSSAAMRGGGRRRSSVGRRVRASLAAEAIPEEAVAPPPPPPATVEEEQEEQEADDAQQEEANNPAAAVADAAADAHAADGGTADDVTQEMDISMSLTGATPGLLGASHSTPQHNWQHQQKDATPVQHLDETPQQEQQHHQHLDMESPELGVPVSAAAAAAAAYAAPAEVQHGDPAGCDSDGMDIDADENAAPASPAAGPAGGSAAAGDVDGLTTNLLLDDNRQLMGWGHVPLAVHNTRPSLGGGGGLTTHTGRGSVGSNVLTMHSHRFGQTTQLLADSVHKDLEPQLQTRAPGAAATRAQQLLAARQHASTPAAAGAAAGGAAGGGAVNAYAEECTTKLLADSTSASGIMGLLPQPRARLLSSTIAGGAPVGHPAAAAAATGLASAGREQSLQQPQQQQDGDELRRGGQLLPAARGPFGAGSEYEMSPELGGRSGSRLPGAGGMEPQQQPAAAEGEASPVDHWNSLGQQQQQRVAPWELQHRNATAAVVPSPPLPVRQPHLAASTAAAGRRDAREGDEPTLELAAGVTQGVTLNGQSMLEDATLEDFALPPEMMGAADERPITMPFSGTLPSGPGPVAQTPGGSVVRSAQPITFSDFCQIVDLQFLTHIRRGTSISVCDFAPSSLPQDLCKALELLSITSCEVSVLESAMHELQAEMHSKRQDAYEQEDRLGTDNPPVFATVQTARPTQLEQTKHCLVLHKKACRSQTAACWKSLRIHMEQQLADKMAQQQADLDEQLAFVQAKLQKAQQQREYAKAFHADVLKKLAAEEAAQQDAAAARARLVCLRNRLAELRGLNTDRQQRAAALQQRVAESEAQRAELTAELKALQARRDQLSSVVAATPQPAASKRALRRLQQASEQLQLVQTLQGCKMVSDAAGGYLLSFQGLLAVRLEMRTAAGAAAAADGSSLEATRLAGRLVLLPRGAAAAGATAAGSLKLKLLQDMVSVLQPRCSFEAVPALVPDVLTEVEAVASRAIELAEASQEAFLTQPLLTAVSISCKQQQAQQTGTNAGSSSSSSMSPGAGADVGAGDVVDGGCLVLTLVEPDARVKMEVALRLRDLLAHAHPGTRMKGIRVATQVLVAPQHAQAGLQQKMQAALESAVQGPYRLEDESTSTTTVSLLRCVCQQAIRAIKA